jgi:carbon-monoxide dehydrogenase medium subunit
MNFRVIQPALLIDLNRITELDYVRREDGGGLRLGALDRQRRLEQDPLIRETAPLLSEAMPWVAHPQIRNRGTLGGSLAHADPAAELPVILLALNGRVRARRLGGERTIEAHEFFRGMFSTDLQPEEIVIEVELPPMAPRTGWCFLEVARRRGDYAMAGVAVTLTLGTDGRCEAARFVYLNAGDGPVVADKAAETLLGQEPTAASFDAASQAAILAIDPLGTLHATPAFQRHLAGTLTRRALATALVRAQQRASG